MLQLFSCEFTKLKRLNVLGIASIDKKLSDVLHFLFDSVRITHITQKYNE